MIVTPRGFQIQPADQGDIEVVPEHRDIQLDELCRNIIGLGIDGGLFVGGPCLVVPLPWNPED